MSPLPMRSRTWEQESGTAYVPQYASSFPPWSPVGSSRYSGTPLFISPTEDALARRVIEMGHELEALRMRSECPYELDFNAAPAFTLKIMEQVIPPRFKIPKLSCTMVPPTHWTTWKHLRRLCCFMGLMMGLCAKLSRPHLGRRCDNGFRTYRLGVSTPLNSWGGCSYLILSAADVRGARRTC